MSYNYVYTIHNIYMYMYMYIYINHFSHLSVSNDLIIVSIVSISEVINYY